MPGKSTALTEPGIQRLSKAPTGKRVEKFDRLAPGLCLRVSDKGRKTWVAHYRIAGDYGADGKTLKLSKLSLGDWPGVKVDEARDRMRHIRDQAVAGIDPKAEREREQEAARREAEREAERLRTFKVVAEEYIKRECGKLKRGAETESVIRRHLIPAWGDTPLTDLRKRDAIRLTDGLVDAGHHGAALKLHEVIRRVFNWAADRDEIDVSPFANLKPPVKKEPRQRALSHDEMRTLWAAWTDQSYPFGPLHKLLLLTGQRRGEVGEMRRRELDDPDKPTVWTIPAERSKNGKPHRVPLSGAARDLLASLPTWSAGDYLFSTTSGRRPVSGFSKAKDRMDRLAAEKHENHKLPKVEDWRVHDLRRTVRTEMARLGVSEAVAEKVLNHSGDALVRTYDVYAYETEKADALERWARELQVIVGETERPSNVTRLPDREAL